MRPALTLNEVRRVAVHEAGHAVAALKLNLVVGFVSAMREPNRDGFVAIRSGVTESNRRAWITALMAGPLAEEKAFGAVSGRDTDGPAIRELLEPLGAAGPGVLNECQAEAAALVDKNYIAITAL